MIKFDELIKKADEVYFKGIQTQEDGKHYIDPRTERGEDGRFIVKPFCFLNGHYWYVCPNCDEIHATNDFGTIVTRCCDGDNQRVKVQFGILQAVQYAPIYLDV